jgi:uncharacterized protein YndB with AHSA1/START domain
MKKEALRVSTTIPTAPTTLYLAWISSEQHTAMTGGVAKIDSQVGSKFSAWDGYITGKLITLDLGRRIVMSWRTTDFPRDATDSRVEIHFEALGGSTRVTILHTEIPEGQSEKYRQGWNDHYFNPMRTHFSKFLPDPRKPPPPRRPPPPPEEEEEEEPITAKKKGPGVAKAPPSSKAVAPPPSKKGAAPPPSKKGAAAAPPSKKPAAAPPPSKKAAAPPPSKKAAPPPPSKKPAPPPAKKPAAPAKKPPPAKKPAPKKPAPKKKR